MFTSLYELAPLNQVPAEMEYDVSNNCCKKQWSAAGKKEETSSQEIQFKEADEGGIKTQKMAESS